MTEIDFGRHSDDYAAYRPGFPASFYRRLDGLAPLAGADALDLATGPGTVALELAARGSRVLGIDVSAEQVAAASRVARERDLAERTRFIAASAQRTGLPEASFDLVTAGQCWHWFDGPAAMGEALRVLRPGGKLAIAYYSYLAQHSPVARDTEQLVLAFNPSWTMAGTDGIDHGLVDDLVYSGFELIEQFGYHHDETFSHEQWRGRMRTCNGVGSGGLPPREVERFDRELARMLAQRYPDPVDVEHRVWCAVGRKPA